MTQPTADEILRKIIEIADNDSIPEFEALEQIQALSKELKNLQTPRDYN